MGPDLGTTQSLRTVPPIAVSTLRQLRRFWEVSAIFRRVKRGRTIALESFHLFGGVPQF